MRHSKIARQLLLLLLVISLLVPSFAEKVTWTSLVDEMIVLLDEAADIYKTGDSEATKNKINEAYFGYYEAKGIERTVLNYISGSRAREVEAQFGDLKGLVKKKESIDIVNAEFKKLKEMLVLDAGILDGTIDKETHKPINKSGMSKSGGVNSFAGVFGLSLTIIVREGAEAILIVAAILAFLSKAGQKSSMKTVYIGVFLALVMSVVMAILINQIPNLSGANQEIFEGITMLIAVAMLFYVGTWFLEKADEKAWTGYIKDQVGDSIEKGSAFSLAFTAFLAVFREGAELIIMYQGLQSNPQAKWAGFFVGILILVVVYILVRFLSLRLPLKPFFLVTSVLIYAMAIIFIGNAVFEFWEADVLSLTRIPFLPKNFTIDWLGIYPYYETLIPQLIALVLAVVLSIRQRNKRQKSSS